MFIFNRWKIISLTNKKFEIASAVFNEKMNIIPLINRLPTDFYKYKMFAAEIFLKIEFCFYILRVILIKISIISLRLLLFINEWIII